MLVRNIDSEIKRDMPQVYLGLGIRHVNADKILLVREQKSGELNVPLMCIGDRLSDFCFSATYLEEAQDMSQRILCGPFRNLHHKHHLGAVGADNNADVHFFLGDFEGEPVEGSDIYSVEWVPYDECLRRGVSPFARVIAPFLKILSR